MATKKITIQTFHPGKASRLGEKFGTLSESRKKLGLGAHRGLDYTFQEGTQLVAVGSGVVKNIGHTNILGYFIEHSITVLNAGKREFRIVGYYHLKEDQSKKWKVGDKVVGGEPIALSGNTGTASSGAHLHLMMGKTDNLATSPVEDPLPFIEATLTPVEVEVTLQEKPANETPAKKAPSKPAKK